MSDIFDRVRKVVVEHLEAKEEEVTPTSSFIEDLGADSLDLAELVMAFEEEFDIQIDDDDQEKIVSVKDAIEYIEKKL